MPFQMGGLCAGTGQHGRVEVDADGGEAPPVQLDGNAPGTAARIKDMRPGGEVRDERRLAVNVGPGCFEPRKTIVVGCPSRYRRIVCPARSRHGGLLVDLLGEVVLDADGGDHVELAFQPIGVSFLIHQAVLQELPGAVVSFGYSQGNPAVVPLDR